MKNIKIINDFLLLIMERFEKYIQEVEVNTSCEQFLDEYQLYVSQIKDNKDLLREWKIHNALSNFKRFSIYLLLKHRPMCTCALAKVFSVSDGTITHHLKILENAGLIMGKKEGYFTRYYTKQNLINQLTQIE